MVGPNPYKLFSFKELRAVLGPVFVVCWPCRRYVQLEIGPIALRDHRHTTFSCCRCGGDGKCTVTDPSKDPKTADVKLDPVERPARHPKAVDRLTQTYMPRPVSRHVDESYERRVRRG